METEVDRRSRCLVVVLREDATPLSGRRQSAMSAPRQWQQAV